MKIYLLVILCLVFAGCSNTTETADNKRIGKTENTALPTPAGLNEKSDPNKTTSSQAAFDPNKTSFTATELAAILNTHADKADKAYYSKKLTVTGKVLSVGSDGASFKFRTEPPGNAGVENWDIIPQEFTPEDEKKVSALKPGQEVTVNCTYRGYAKNTGFALKVCELQ